MDRSKHAGVFSCAVLLGVFCPPPAHAQADALAQSLADSPEPVTAPAPSAKPVETIQPAAAQEDFFPLEIPVLINGANAGDISAEATLSGYAKVSAARLLELLTEVISAEQAEFLTSFGDQNVLLETLRAGGISAVYDPSELTLKVNMFKGGARAVSLSGRTIENINMENMEAAASLSAGMSLTARPRYIHNTQTGNTGLAPLAADMRGFVSVGGFNNTSLSYEADYLEGRESQVKRGDVTLTHDNFENAMRYQAGDIRPTISGYQNSIDMMGISVERNYNAIQPFRNLTPGGRTRFTLERPARVSYEVNGVVLGGRMLQPGDYDIRDFPLVTGANDVRIIVDDEFGTREVGAYSTFVDSDLLASGTLLFGANIGVRSKRSATDFDPDYGEDIIATGFVEKGISDRWTLGAQAEYSNGEGFVGGRAVTGFGDNVIALEVGLSSFDNSDMGTAATLRYANRPHRDSNGSYNQFDAQIAYQNDGFQTIGSNGITRGESWEVSARDSYSWNDNSVSANVSWRKSDQDEITTGGVSWRRPYKGVNVSLGYQAVHSKKDNDSDNRFFVTLSRNFGERGSVRARTATGPNESEIEWRKLSTRSIGASAARASYKFGEQQDELSADASYIASRAEIDVGHNSIIEGGEIITASTNVRLGMGFGFADGSFAFGRPVANGFYILQGHPTLKGHEISAYQGRDQMTGKTGLFGPALVPLNGAYREQVYRVDIEDLPIGYDMGSGQVQMFPSFNSGYRIKIGSDPTTLVIGRIHGADGEPVKLGFGKLIRVGSDAGTIEPIEFFTNRTGRFVAERVKAGTYALILQPGDRNIGQITVTEGEDGVQQIGTLTIKETP